MKNVELENEIKKVIDEELKVVKSNIKNYGRRFYDEIYFNRYTNVKPSDIKTDVMIYAIAALSTNKKHWFYVHNRVAKQAKIYADAYNTICLSVYNSTKYDPNDVMLFYRLKD